MMKLSCGNSFYSLIMCATTSFYCSQAMAEEATNATCKISFDGASIIDGGCYVEFDGAYTMIFSPVTDVTGEFKYQHFIRIENNEDSGFVNYNGGQGWDHAQVELGEFVIVGDNEQGVTCFKGGRGEVCFKQR